MPEKCLEKCLEKSWVRGSGWRVRTGGAVSLIGKQNKKGKKSSVRMQSHPPTHNIKWHTRAGTMSLCDTPRSRAHPTSTHRIRTARTSHDDDMIIWWWYDDVMIWWYDDMMIWWYDDIMILWYDDLMMFWYDEIMIWRYYDIMILCYYVVMILWYDDVMLLWYWPRRRWGSKLIVF